MALFSKISEMAKNVGDKTGDMIEVNKLNGLVSDAEKRIVEQKKAIGEYCWTQYIANMQLDPEAAKLCAAIKEDEALIAKTQAEIRSIKADKAAAPVVVEAGLLRCQECGTPNPEGTKFCQNCGRELEIPAPAEPVEVATCPSCGTQNAVGTRFCQTCGRDMEAAPDVLEPPPVAGPISGEPGGPVCPACGKVNQEGNRFCMECGTTLPAAAPAAETPPEEPAGPLCPSCGAANKEGDRFCMGCGAPLSVPEPSGKPEPVEEPAVEAPAPEPAEPAPAEEPAAEEPAPAGDAAPVAQTPSPEETPSAEEKPNPEPEEAPEATAPAPLICPACGTVNRPGVKFCGECGARLEG